MSEKKIVVPDWMLTRACEYYQRTSQGYPRMDMVTLVRGTLEAALRWLSENPIVPTDEQLKDLRGSIHPQEATGGGRWMGATDVEEGAVEWQRMMFLAPEPEIPDQIKDLIREQTLPTGQWYTIGVDVHNQAILEAFRRGQKAGPQ